MQEAAEQSEQALTIAQTEFSGTSPQIWAATRGAVLTALAAGIQLCDGKLIISVVVGGCLCVLPAVC